MSKLGAIVKAGAAAAKRATDAVDHATDKIPGGKEAKKQFVHHAEKLERKVRPGTRHENPFKHGSLDTSKRAERGARNYRRAFVGTSVFPADVAGAAIHPALAPVAAAGKAAAQIATYTGMNKRKKALEYLKNRHKGGQTPSGQVRRDTYREWVERILQS